MGREYEIGSRGGEEEKGSSDRGGRRAGGGADGGAEGHEVTLFDKSTDWEGWCSRRPGQRTELETLLDLVRYLALQIAELGVTVTMGRRLVFRQSKGLSRTQSSRVGGKPGRSDTWGPWSNVMSGESLHSMLKTYLKFIGPKAMEGLTKFWMPIGKKGHYHGGAIQGCELAEFLVKRHRTVTIVEAGEELGQGMTVDNQRRLVRWLEEKGVVMLTGVKYEEITGKGLVVVNREGKKVTLNRIPYCPSASAANDDLVKDCKR